MPINTEGLLGQIGYDASSLSELFGQQFAEPKAAWEQFLQPSFTLAQEALGELPGQRAGLLGELSSGLQRRSFVAGRKLAGRAATAGFQGSGQIEQLGELGRRDIGREYTQGRRGIGEDIAKREAGILGALSGNVSSFLQSLVSSGAELASGVDYGSTIPPGALPYIEWRNQGGQGGKEGYLEYLSRFESENTIPPESGPGSVDISDAPGNYYNPFG